jgi:hypothetical protein
MRSAVLFASILILSAGSPTIGGESPIVVSGSGYSREEVDRAITLFRQACKPLGDERYWSELVEVKVETGAEYAPHRLARGWSTGLHLMLRVPDRPTRIPTYDDSTGVIAGHTLHYDLGGGKTPGFLSSKRVSQFLCGAPVSQDGSESFKAVPGMSVLGAKPGRR